MYTLVFSTNITNGTTAQALVQGLMEKYPECAVTVDMQDCDKILRIQNTILEADVITHAAEMLGVRLVLIASDVIDNKEPTSV